ncbi:SpoIIE family protein phosphatase [Micromonospora sp. WMMC241]|uniref:SpoIIE family protein phosphatase n=1 Tax=Micromonospora sp. WMMC241 TaxID=3015159 RepID=UPI0022B6A246|nr:SpoIIE family protein phosphatase [Micromonospora sp. WMMC241]MCZ7439591.1 SpoIIE family protein phosphatase [Micromonospora sp. WMMC241]
MRDRAGLAVGDGELLPPDVLRRTGAQVAVLVLLDPGGTQLDLVDQVGMVPELAETWARFPLAAPVGISRAARTGEVIEADSFRERLIRFPATASLPTADVEGLVAAPLWHPGADGTIIGAISLGFRGVVPPGTASAATTLAATAARRVRAAGLRHGARRPVADEPGRPGPSPVASLGRSPTVAAIDQALLETVLLHLPVGVSVLDRDLRFVTANQRAAEINGRPAADHVGRHLREVLPDLPESFADQLRQVLDTGRPMVNLDVVGATPGRPDRRRWRGSYYPVHGATPVGPVGVAAVFDEVADEATLGVEQVTADRATMLTALDTLVENAPVGVALLDTDLRYLRINAILAEWNGHPVADHLGRRVPDLFPELGPVLEPLMRELADAGEVRDVEIVRAGRTYLSSFLAVPGGGGRAGAVAVLVTDVTRRRREELRARRVQEFTAALSQAASVAEVVEAVRDGAGPAAEAALAAVALMDESGRQIRFAPTGQEPPARWKAVGRDAVHPIAATFRDEEPRFFPDIQPLVDDYPEVAEAVRRSPHRSWAMVPLHGRGTAAGVLIFGYADAQEFEPAHRNFLVTLAGLAGQALARAQLYEREHATAVRLQRSLLPSRLPRVPGADLAAVYLAGDSAGVGGDFYDVFPVDGAAGREWVLVVGDVAGRGVDAASVTGLARHTLRITAALAEPATALRQLHARLRNDPDVDRFLSVVCLRLRLRDGGADLELASGGHPPALVRRADGRVEVINLPGVLLGAFPEVRLGRRSVALEAGDTVLLYTDGVIEARGPDGLFGEERLVELLRGASAGDPRRLVELVRDGVAAYQLGPVADDIAILALRVGG